MKRFKWSGDRVLGVLVALTALVLFDESAVTGLDAVGLEVAGRFSNEAQGEALTAIITLDATGSSDPLSQREQLIQVLAQLRQAGPAAVVLAGVDTGPLLSPVLREWRESAAQQLAEVVEPSPLVESLAESLASAVALTDLERPLQAALEQSAPLYVWSPGEAPTGEPLVVTGEGESASVWLSTLPPFWRPAVEEDSEQQPVADRAIALFTRSEAGLQPRLSLQLMAAYLRQPLSPQGVGVNGGVSVGSRQLTTDAAYRFFPRGPSPEPVSLSAAEALSAANGAASPLHKRVVIIARAGEEARALQLAGEVEALLATEGWRVPPWSTWARLAALLVVAITLVGLLPRLGVAALSGVVIVELLLLLNLQFILMLVQQLWLPMLLPAVALLSGFLLLLVRRRSMQPYRHLQESFARVSQQFARQLLSGGQLEQAYAQLESCPRSDEVLALLYDLGLACEQRRQFVLAERVFTDIASRQSGYRDAAERARINREAHERVVLPGQSSTALASTMVIDSAELQRPVLGRYQLERELGRGAMGVVYLGSDPKIGRTVAIKTMALSQEFEGEQYTEVRDRFLREAETAGRLNHSNIVTIYDVGEEADVAYIAMDYIKGEGLDFYTKPDQLLPVNEVMGIIEQVAEALDYAHANGVIHRDIKPANILYDRDTQMATVTDFGVAHLSDSSKTKTGTVLGSPYYMSPEQLAGTRVDGRADLFSLGVTFYQLLSGALPFQADSVAQLMYKITNSRHTSVRKLNPKVPDCGGRIVNKLLQKDVEKRYQSGQQVVAALQRCLKKGN